MTASIPSFTCPACTAVSHHPDDVAASYCGRCHWWTGDPELAAQRPDLFTQETGNPSPAAPATPMLDAWPPRPAAT